MIEDPTVAARAIREEAARLGIGRVGFAPVPEGGWPRHDVYRRWLAAGHAGEMGYLARDAEPRRDPRAILATARSIVTVALSYAVPDGALVPGDALVRGRVARYARGADYHTVFKSRLTRLATAVSQRLGRGIAWRACVDTAPLLERDAAEAGGLGFVAKNTLVIAPGLGSWILLGELLVDLELPVAERMAPRCGSCRACLDACPTGAIVDEYTVDARRCISYLTIEIAGAIPRELRRAVGDRVFGCDVCQEVCPFNAGAATLVPPDRELAGPLGDERERLRPSLVRLLGLGAAQFRKYVRRTALRRVHRAQLLRNVAVALGNVGGPSEVAPLARALDEPSPLVRAHAAWALGEIARRHDDEAARSALRARAAVEEDATVREELALAL